MKATSLPIGCWVLVALVMAAVAFVLLSRGSTPAFEGIYVRTSQHEFGAEWDTIVIQSAGADAYHITRRWKYERILDGGALTPEYKLVYTSAVLVPNERVLLEEESGLTYRIQDTQLQIGATNYQKLK